MRRITAFFSAALFALTLGGCATTEGSPDPGIYQFRPSPRAGTNARGLGPPPERRVSKAGALPTGWPVEHEECRVISPYGVYRGRSRFHRGTDIKAPRGVPVLATAAGKITFSGAMRGYGKLVVIDHGGDVKTAYGHLDSIAVKVGQSVQYRQPIGRLGATGNASTHHVHYEVRVKDKTVDPMPYISPSDL